jgi:hypothetical protein
MSGNRSHFDPGSSVIKFMESDGKTVRVTESKDLVQICRVNDALENVICSQQLLSATTCRK